jgi:putative aldouronate transport system substrate-binding protein
MTRSFTRRTALAGGTALASSAVLTSCNGSDDENVSEVIASPDDNVITDTSDPRIVKEKTVVKFMSRRPATTADDWNTTACMKEAEKTTNLAIDFGLVPDEGIGEKQNLALASGEYPEAFYRTSIGAGDLAKYAEQGTFIPLDELIDTYMPNFSNLLNDNDDIRKGITLPDGKIYSLPEVRDHDFAGMRCQLKLWARQDWLDEFGMDVPETLDEYRAFLKEAVSAKKKDGAAGLADGGSMGYVFPSLFGSFGVGNRGTGPGNIDVDPDSGDLRFFPISDGYRDLLSYLHDLHDDGSIPTDAFSFDLLKFNNLGAEGTFASVVTQAPEDYFGDVGDNYVALPPLKRAAGDEVPTWNFVNPDVSAICQFALTDKCAHPIEIARWADFWYGDEGAKLFFMGVEGESYEEKSDGYELLPKITEGQSIDEGLKSYAMYLGGGYPAVSSERFFKGVESTPQAAKGSALVSKFAIKDSWPAFTFTNEEADILSSIGTDIDKHLEESRSGFVTGKKSLDDWDDYVEQFQKMGLEDYMKVQRAALDRRN